MIINFTFNIPATAIESVIFLLPPFYNASSNGIFFTIKSSVSSGAASSCVYFSCQEIAPWSSLTLNWKMEIHQLVHSPATNPVSSFNSRFADASISWSIGPPPSGISQLY
jgi:hypothetical protein